VDSNYEVVIVDEANEELLGSLELLVLHEERILEPTTDTLGSHIIKIDNWFMSIGNEDI